MTYQTVTIETTAEIVSVTPRISLNPDATASNDECNQVANVTAENCKKEQDLIVNMASEGSVLGELVTLSPDNGGKVMTPEQILNVGMGSISEDLGHFRQELHHCTRDGYSIGIVDREGSVSVAVGVLHDGFTTSVRLLFSDKGFAVVALQGEVWNDAFIGELSQFSKVLSGVRRYRPREGSVGDGIINLLADFCSDSLGGNDE